MIRRQPGSPPAGPCRPPASGRPRHAGICPGGACRRLPWEAHCLSLLGFGSQGRDLKLCLWDLAEGRNAVVDSVGLESVGFCRGSVLARGQQRWMLAVPGRGSDEVSASLPIPLFTSHRRLSFPTWAWAWAASALGCRSTALHRTRRAVGGLGLTAGCSSRGLGMGLHLGTWEMLLVATVRKEAHRVTLGGPGTQRAAEG